MGKMLKYTLFVIAIITILVVIGAYALTDNKEAIALIADTAVTNAAIASESDSDELKNHVLDAAINLLILLLCLPVLWAVFKRINKTYGVKNERNQ